MWLVARRKRNKLLDQLAGAEANLKNQDALQRSASGLRAGQRQADAGILGIVAIARCEPTAKLSCGSPSRTSKRSRKGEARTRRARKGRRSAGQADPRSAGCIAATDRRTRKVAQRGLRRHQEPSSKRCSSARRSLTQETQNLVKALRRPEVRGRWGEITLRRLVELAGMVEHCDFQEQVHTVDDEQIIRPDMIVRMPDQPRAGCRRQNAARRLPEAVEADDDAQRKLGLERHAKNVRAHIRMLASKAYWDQFERARSSSSCSFPATSS